MTDSADRRVTANLTLSLDGYHQGPTGPGDFSMFAPYTTSETARRQLARTWEGATTALFGRVNAEVSLGYWPSVAEDGDADPRERAYGQWLADTEKVVFSTTLTEMPWAHTHVVNAPVPDIVAELKVTGEGDIVVNSSLSLVQPLLAADLIDRLHLLVLPQVVGAGQRLFESDPPTSKWKLTHREKGELGESAMVYDRPR
ncbi:dihydrofolate reductase family protein [Streptomyces sp. NPDC004111]|uniref:dihydrofolate reductase family protein n=1 Tax=Streptomyces sp. NPDC004111 TaxID=3364690 RepID=UPI0036C04619